MRAGSGPCPSIPFGNTLQIPSSLLLASPPCYPANAETLATASSSRRKDHRDDTSGSAEQEDSNDELAYVMFTSGSTARPHAVRGTSKGECHLLEEGPLFTDCRKVCYIFAVFWEGPQH